MQIMAYYFEIYINVYVSKIYVTNGATFLLYEQKPINPLIRMLNFQNTGHTHLLIGTINRY